jgi:N-acetylglucosaminyldiphosphoundecaprenol N-acetyl-beta-D-mannosaminyltransferase
VGQGVTERDTTSVLGVAVDRLSMRGAISRVGSLIMREGCEQQGYETAHVVTANSEIIMMAKEQSDFAEILARAALVVPDGIGVVWAARLLGDRLPERVAGIDLMDEVLAVCANRGWRPFFLGAAPGVAEEAVSALKQRFPGLQIAGVHHGYFDATEEAAVLEMITLASPDLLLVAMGAPRQEYWIARHRAELRGAGVDGANPVASSEARPMCRGVFNRSNDSDLFVLETHHDADASKMPRRIDLHLAKGLHIQMTRVRIF